MRRIDEIRARVVNVANREAAVGTGMRIPGMKIGTQLSPRGPSLEDINWIIELLERAGKFIETAEYVKEDDRLVAQRLVAEVRI